MPTIELYTTPTCPYCLAAKALLDKKGVAYKEMTVIGDPAKRQEMLQRSNGSHTVPQIFIGDRHIGGFDDMNALDRKGKLDALLSRVAS
ncbi:glutaredoxin 3 [Maritalea sp.]|uniref:glutaredoxin 3 n=1 Tax=Maritalea sp. TaxID=2003361 RepID=UPI003EF34D87